ncbi:MAG: energy-coupling factor transporter transmembrane protein EcfT [Clostridiales bacterium]|nr:energy-coupling factor transporter transmembrane protein EcfT [Clostridiales bacterium]
MLKDITLGQYFPLNSPIHRIDPRMKLISAIVYIVAIFFAKSAIAYGFILLTAILLILFSKIPIITILKSLKPLIIIIIITGIINIFWYQPKEGAHLLASFWIINIYLEGIISAVYMLTRIACIIIGTSVILTYTTSPIALTDGLEQMLAPLGKLHIPVHEFSMMMTIAMRFIPTIIEETDKIMSAQKARGSDFSSGNIIKRIKALVPILIPLFVSSFRRADELATAMECRCYRGGEGRTKMIKLRFRFTDFLWLFMVASMIAIIIVINIYLPFYIV